jgi:HipA-like protein
VTGITFAVQYIRRMRGGAQSQLLRCDDGAYYVVKFQNNPQGIKVLANDLLGTILARQLGLPVCQPAIVIVREALIHNSDDMYIELKSSHAPCRSGSCFGSRYPSHKNRAGSSVLDMTYDCLPRAEIPAVENLADFAGMFVFDRWTGNTDTRQAIFNREKTSLHYRATMIDQGCCFNGAKWNFPSVPARISLYDSPPYSSCKGFDAFEPWLDRLEDDITETTLLEAGKEIPKEWYEYDVDGLARLLESLNRRRKGIRDLLWTLLKACPKSFPNWSEPAVDQETLLQLRPAFDSAVPPEKPEGAYRLDQRAR